mmetsp:Transcript_113934/g.317257  ORF Transcript_113934/g.317257 Transcript_113934/m.317257 type:complete len:297 (+) Transcript_113934:60-950(+)
MRCMPQSRRPLFAQSLARRCPCHSTHVFTDGLDAPFHEGPRNELGSLLQARHILTKSLNLLGQLLLKLLQHISREEARQPVRLLCVKQLRVLGDHGAQAILRDQAPCRSSHCLQCTRWATAGRTGARLLGHRVLVCGLPESPCLFLQDGAMLAAAKFPGRADHDALSNAEPVQRRVAQLVRDGGFQRLDVQGQHLLKRPAAEGRHHEREAGRQQQRASHVEVHVLFAVRGDIEGVEVVAGGIGNTALHFLESRFHGVSRVVAAEVFAVNQKTPQCRALLACETEGPQDARVVPGHG